MIYFQTKPDGVFEAILQEALVSESVEVKLLADDGAIESWEGLYPESSRRFTPYSAVRMMHQMLAACRDVMVYRLSEDHWLVLYECVRNFCSTHNDLLEDQGQGVRLIGNYKIGFVDEEAIVNIYFWDTDFLITSHSDPWEFWPNHEADGHHEHTVCPTAENKDFDIPVLELVDDVAWLVPNAEEFYRDGSTQYPDRV